LQQILSRRRRNIWWDIIIINTRAKNDEKLIESQASRQSLRVWGDVTAYKWTEMLSP